MIIARFITGPGTEQTPYNVKINYLEYVKKNSKPTNWKGECFVFDNRVTINKKLMPGKYIQCHGCRTPITKKETMSDLYVNCLLYTSDAADE